MTIEELKLQKQSLEENILRLVREFEKNNRMHAKTIYTIYTEPPLPGSRPNETIKIKVELDLNL